MFRIYYLYFIFYFLKLQLDNSSVAAATACYHGRVDGDCVRGQLVGIGSTLGGCLEQHVQDGAVVVLH